MPRDKTSSHERVLAAARAEFLACGYLNASMRRIAARAGMTAAGLYRHCRDKADLFEQLVTPPAERLNVWLDAHIARNVSGVRSGNAELWQETEIGMMREIVYPHMEDYRLLLTKSEGTRYADYLHDLTELHQVEMLRFLPLLREKGYPIRDVSAQELHLLLSAYTTALFEPVIHGYSLEEALRCLETVEAFFLPGWKQLMGF